MALRALSKGFSGQKTNTRS